jgi:hypothetical protein
LVRIEPFFLIAFVILYGIVNVHYVEPEFGLTMALIPALAIQVALTVVFTRSENVLGAVGAIVSSPLFNNHCSILTYLTLALASWRNDLPRDPNSPSHRGWLVFENTTERRNAAVWVGGVGTCFTGMYHCYCVRF